MNISAPFIKRPVATALLAVAVLLMGMLGYRMLPVSSLPQVDFPTIQVVTQLPGARADTIELLVTASLERQLGQIPALASMTSTSSFGISQITLQFDLSRNIDAASQDVQAAINAAGSSLPKNLPYPPTYSKVNPADTPVVTLALTSDTSPMTKLSDIADTLLLQRLSEVTGVGHVAVEGSIRPAIRIQADIARLSNYNLGLEDIRSAIANANVATPKGSINGSSQAYTIATNDQLTKADEYNDIVVSYKNGAPLLLKNVAKIVIDIENTKVASWYNGKPAIIINIQRQPDANVVDTVKRIRNILPQLQNAMPGGANLDIVNDRTGTIRASVSEVQFTLILSVFLVILVVLLFLQTLEATIIAGVTLPLSIVATFGVMYLCGYSLDNLSLMALTIGSGFIVDDAIVMIENIVRHIEKGEKPMQAALKGAKEIGFTVISLTVSLVAVFIPLLFMEGLVGRLFREFAVTLTIAVVTSAIVSLTLTPMMCSLLLKSKHTKNSILTAILNVSDNIIHKMLNAYKASLKIVLRHETIVLMVFIFTFVATILMYIYMPKGFLPQQDTALINAVTESSQDVSFEQMKKLQIAISEIIRKDKDVTGVVSLVGVGSTNPTPNTGHLAISLKPKDERKDDINKIIKRLQQETANFPGISMHFQPVQYLQINTRASRTRYQYTLVDTDKATLINWSKQFIEKLQNLPELKEVTSDIQENGLSAKLNIDRVTAGRYGVSMQSVNDTLNDMFGQRQVSTIYSQANQYRVILEADSQYQKDLSQLSKLYVPSSTGVQVPLGAINNLEMGTSALSISHQEQFPAVTISFNLAKGASLGDAINAISKTEKELTMPASTSGSYSGDTAEFSKSLNGQIWLILAAIIIIYIILGVLYESFIHPVTILSTLPSAGIGALLALMLCGQDLSLVALIGIILLMGIVKKNAIMMIDFALEAERNQGLAPHESIMQACILRFRPIMMTSFAALLGALPLALTHGIGSELRNPLGISIIGGLLLSQLLTLYTTPVIYLFMERIKSWLIKEFGFSLDDDRKEVERVIGRING